MILDIHNCHYPRSACPPGSPNCQFLSRLLLVSHMPWTVLRPSFRLCQVEPTTCTSRCALPNSHLHAGCQCLRCRIPRQSQFSSAYAPDEFSCLAWTFHRQANVRQQSALPISAPVGMAASTLRACFGQPTKRIWVAGESKYCFFFYQNLFLSNEHLLNVHKSI